MYLSGVTNDRDEPFLIANGIGLVLRPGNSYHLRADRYPFHGCDVGMGFREADPYLEWLDQRPREHCVYAVSPDHYPDAVKSLERGRQYAGLVREMGFPVAIVAQDNAERLEWPWDDFDVLFVGGEIRPGGRGEWKTSPAAERLCRQARANGKWVHMGRVNSIKRLERARSMGCNSADGTFIRYRRRRRASEDAGTRDARGAAEIDAWLNFLAANATLPGFTQFEAPRSHPNQLALYRP